MTLRRHTRDVTISKVVAFGNYGSTIRPCGSFKHTLKDTIVLKYERIRTTTHEIHETTATAVTSIGPYTFIKK